MVGCVEGSPSKTLLWTVPDGSLNCGSMGSAMTSSLSPLKALNQMVGWMLLGGSESLKRLVCNPCWRKCL